MRLALAAVAILPVVLAAAWPSPPAPSGDYIKVEMRGRLRTGIMAIGGETTGVVITSRGELRHVLPGYRDHLEAVEGRHPGD